eukprot:jgi/Mesen1/3004/ME000177S02283
MHVVARTAAGQCLLAAAGAKELRRSFSLLPRGPPLRVPLVPPGRTSRCSPLKVSAVASDVRSYGASATNGDNGQGQGQGQRVFTNYTIYKGKGAVNVVPIKPTFEKRDGGGIVLAKEGAILFEFAASIGTRVYDWKKKQMIALRATEVGSLIALNPDERVEFFHDPNMGRSGEGKVSKSLKVEPMPKLDGYYFNLRTRLAPISSSNEVAMGVVFLLGYAGIVFEESLAFNKAGVGLLMAVFLWVIRSSGPPSPLPFLLAGLIFVTDSISGGAGKVTFGVPVTKAEFAVLRTMGQYLIPHMLGLDLFCNPSTFDESMLLNSGIKESTEWNR